MTTISTPVDMVKGTKHSTNYGLVKVLDYVNKSNVKVRFVTTGSEVVAGAQGIRAGYVKDPKGAIRIPDSMLAGVRYPTNNSGDLEIVEYASSREVKVKFLATDNVVWTHATSIRNGLVYDPSMRKARTGVAPPDMASGTVHDTNKGKVRVVKYVNSRKVRIKFLNTGVKVWSVADQIRKGSVKDPNVVPLDMVPGTVFATNYCGDLEIVEYLNKAQVKVVFPATGFMTTAQAPHIRRGVVADHLATTDRRVSLPERKVANFLVKLGVKAKQSVRSKLRNPETGRRLELDLYVPGKRLAIEINGVYWHSAKFKDSSVHQKKLELCIGKTNPIRLLQFWDTDVVNNWPVVRSMIRNAVGMCKHRVYARDCEIRPITPVQSSLFFARNHLKGNAGAQVHYGLFFDDELVSAMTFSKPKFDRTHDWEIIRLASKRGYSVVGGASRLFANFTREHDAKNCMTYADLMTGTGGVYEQLGFKRISTTEPGFFWVIGTKLLSRYQCQKHKLEKLFAKLGKVSHEAQISAVANMENIGGVKLYDAGNAKLSWSA